MFHRSGNPARCRARSAPPHCDDRRIGRALRGAGAIRAASPHWSAAGGSPVTGVACAPVTRKLAEGPGAVRAAARCESLVSVSPVESAGGPGAVRAAAVESAGGPGAVRAAAGRGCRSFAFASSVSAGAPTLLGGPGTGAEGSAPPPPPPRGRRLKAPWRERERWRGAGP